jgi:hypothetical protein
MLSAITLAPNWFSDLTKQHALVRSALQRLVGELGCIHLRQAWDRITFDKFSPITLDNYIA